MEANGKKTHGLYASLSRALGTSDPLDKRIGRARPHRRDPTRAGTSGRSMGWRPKRRSGGSSQHVCIRPFPSCARTRGGSGGNGFADPAQSRRTLHRVDPASPSLFTRKHGFGPKQYVPRARVAQQGRVDSFAARGL
jgi:hypothetical protein